MAIRFKATHGPMGRRSPTHGIPGRKEDVSSLELKSLRTEEVGPSATIVPLSGGGCRSCMVRLTRPCSSAQATSSKDTRFRIARKYKTPPIAHVCPNKREELQHREPEAESVDGSVGTQGPFLRFGRAPPSVPLQ